MDAPIVELTLNDWGQASSRPEWTAAVEAGKVLYFPQLRFQLEGHELALLREDMLAAGTRNVSLGADGVLKGAGGSADEQRALAAMIGRFRGQALQLVDGLLPAYRGLLRRMPAACARNSRDAIHPARSVRFVHATMIFVLSPAKTLDFETPPTTRTPTQP